MRARSAVLLFPFSVLSMRLIGLLMILLLSFILMAWPMLLAAQSPSNNETKITASDGASGDNFGYSVAISGDMMVVGARSDDERAVNAGAAYIFERDENDRWNQIVKVTVSDGQQGDYFGTSVAISNDTVVVGAFLDDDHGTNSGSAYIFERNQGGANNWGQVQKIIASDGAAADYFGWSVAISGDTVVVGAYEDDDDGTNTGSAYIFSRHQGGTNQWGQVTKLSVSDRLAGDQFGYSVAIDGDTVVIGARLDDDPASSGSAYIFSRNEGGSNNWGQVKKVLASDSERGILFGHSVAVRDKTVIIGAYRDSDHGTYSGSAYIFERDEGGNNNWGQIKKMTASDSAIGDEFGYSVAIHDDLVLIGARSDEIYGSGFGSAYLFHRHQGGANNWGEVQKLTASDAAKQDYFGSWVSISHETLVVGAYLDDDQGSDSGSAYIYQAPGPQLSLPNNITQLMSDTTGISLKVPISLTSYSHDIASLAFSLHYDQSCLSIDQPISDLQAGFQSKTLTETNGELDIAIWSSPIISLFDGTVLNLTFDVDSSCVSQNSVDLSFSTDPLLSFGNTIAQSVTGTVGTDGPLAINIAPDDINLSNQSVNEKEAIGSTVGTFSTVDSNSSDTHTYSLVSGIGATDNISFTLETSGILKTTHIFDFEQQDSFSIRVRSDDGRGGTVEKAFSITINDIAEAPTALNLSHDRIIESEPMSTTVGILSTIDPDNNDTHTYSLVLGTGDTDNSSFDIVNNTLKSKELFDYDTKSNYSVRVGTTDSANQTFEQSFPITVIGYSELDLTHFGHYSPTLSLTSQPISTTLQFAPKGNDVSQANISLDYDQNCLQFSQISGEQNGLTATPDEQNGLLSIGFDGGASALTAGHIATLEFVAKEQCASGTQTQVTFSQNTLTDRAGITVPSVSAVNDSILILSNDSRGDCNSDNRVDAGDFSAIPLELFDADGSDWLNVSQSSFVGSPVGCDANRDELIGVSDIICSVLVFFDRNSCTTAPTLRRGAIGVGLSIAPINSKAGESAEVPINMSSNGHQIAAAAFSLEFDQEIFAFDPADHDGDGIPDAIDFVLPNGVLNSASFDAQNNRLNVVVGHIAFPQKALADGTIATVTLQVKAEAANATIGLTNASLSDTKGRNVPLAN